MFQPQFAGSQRRRVSQTASVPAPVGGWNARDSLAVMDEKDAVLLENWYPRQSHVELRKGSVLHASGIDGVVETLAVYESASGTSKLFAAVGSDIFDVSSSGSVGAAVQSSLSNARWQHTQIQNTAGSFLYMVNGQDKPRLYDGSTWTAVDGSSSPAITGVTTTTLVHVHLFKRRLWFAANASTKAWYLPVDSIGGAANYIDIGPLLKRGGYLMAMGTWTIDAGEGVDDYMVMVSSMGEVVVYKGSDPTSAATWALVGVYEGGYPIGRRCLTKWQGDVLLISKEGLVPLSKALMSARLDTRSLLTDKISLAISRAVSERSTLYGWQVVLYPSFDMLVMNVPLSASTSEQFVMNTSTGSWCKFTGWDAACWALYKDDIYYGTTDGVVKASEGNSDQGSNIVGNALPAFNYFKVRTQLKRWTMARPTISANNAIGVLLGLNVDFDQSTPSGVPTYSASTASQWGSAVWGQSTWGGSTAVKKDWQTLGGIGYCGAIHLIVSSNAAQVEWIANDYVWEPGQVL